MKQSLRGHAIVVTLFIITGFLIAGIAVYTVLFTVSLSPQIAASGISDELAASMQNRIELHFVVIIAAALVILVMLSVSYIFSRRSREVLLNRYRQQELMSELSHSFISAEETSALISGALRITGEFMRLDRMVVVIAEANSSLSQAAYIWNGPHRAALPEQNTELNAMLRDSFPDEQPRVVPTISCSDVRDDKYGAVLKAAGIQAYIWAPLYIEERRWAILSVEQFRPRHWSQSDRQLISTVSSVIAGAVERDLQEKERDAARHAAERASQAKTDFLANMSHEMRTPMNAIIGMTSIARSSADIEKKDYCLTRIENASNHLLGVINDILDMSKIEANKFELSPVEFNFEKLLQKVVNVINFKVEEKQQVFTVNFDKLIPGTLFGDDQRISQVITNLLSNAVKFTPQGGTIRLDAALERKSGDMCAITISVADSGIGISAEQQARLFNSFEQADTSTSRQFGGTGLGLAISRRIVEMMEGSLCVHSQLGQGAEFTFTVMLREVAGTLESLSGPDDWSSIHVLVVDDDPATLDYFSDIAERVGFYCDTAAGGYAALEKIRLNGRYDIYFVDWKMPGMDGIEVSREIKAAGAQAIVIMISSVDWNTVERDAKKAGVDSFLSKPLFPSVVTDCISRYMRKDDESPREKAEPGIEGVFAGKKILLAEDVDINREIVISLLEPTGIAIDCAVNGTEALNLYRQDPAGYDLIFMDVQMPEMDGYEATRLIRSFEAEQPPPPRPVPIIAMTANVFREDVERCLAAGMNSHVGKPLDFDDVLAQMRRYL